MFGPAIDTYRFWQQQAGSYSESAERIDTDRLDPALAEMRADAGDIVRRLERQGVVALPSYWSSDKVRDGRAEIDRLLAEYPACVQRSSGGADERMFGVESVSTLLAEFHRDPLLKGIGERACGLSIYNFATLGARISSSSSNNGSGDGWHRDAHGFQFKTILYLSDVTDETGPFEYLPGSHKSWRAAFDTAVGGLPPAPNTRYDPALVNRMARFGFPRRSFTGQAGTLLLVNTSGIHRGCPLRTGSRYALTNYYYHPFQVGESRIEKFSPLLPGTADRIRHDLPEV